MLSAALGFRDHSGWTIVVALGGDAMAPRLLHRERLELLPSILPRQPYHAVAERGAPRGVIAEVEAEAAKTARENVERIARELAVAGYELKSAGVAVSVADRRGSLDDALRSHALLHAAEGQLYRDAIASAIEPMVPRIRRFLQRDLMGCAPAELGLTAEQVTSHLAAMGRTVGPPWTVNEKEATVAAWVALAGS